MKKNEIIYGLLGLVIGVLFMWSVSVYAVNGNRTNVMRMMGMRYYENHHAGLCSSSECTQP